MIRIAGNIPPLANTIIHEMEEYSKAYYSDYPAQQISKPATHPERLKGKHSTKKPQYVELIIGTTVQVQSRFTET
ncbi:hypothetical protein HNQ91_005791 [Filimonas zeae]|nr:hypothetical protein [Filimonas zeae]MDR6342706.1 hypothetical protein [Filimonas zeae]